MNILHYSLGFPPYRTGGLVKFSTDLMKQQVKEGHNVALLWPGEMLLHRDRTKIKYAGKVCGVDSYEVINPTPISYDEGITQIELFMEVGNGACYERLLEQIKPDVIHVHTLMGLHESLLSKAKEMKIRLVFSAHDFFPICPKVTMFREGRICDCVVHCERCTQCNVTALPIWKVKILQSALYRTLKDCDVVRKLRKNHRDAYLGRETAAVSGESKGIDRAEEYAALRRYYNSLLNDMDVVHFNSNITKTVYEQYMEIPKSEIISISHSDIADNRQKKSFSDHLRITYLGPQGEAKGFYMLKVALDKLWREGKTFQLNVFFSPTESAPYIKMHERYRYEQLKTIFDETDVLVAPSIWYETFGYTVLEALSYGVPVVLSSNVGARDIVPNGGGVIIDHIDPERLAEAIGALTSETLKQMNEVILKDAHIMTMDEMCEQIESRCYREI